MRLTKKIVRTTCAAVIAAFIQNHTSAHAADSLSFSSPEVKPGSTLTTAHVFNGFGCTGENRSPALSWSGAPAGTKSFAVTVYDPDAPTGSGWWHWMVFDIPASANSIPANAGTIGGELLPKGSRQNRIDYGVAAFGGACPPQGDKPHRYIFTLHALKTEKLDVPADATAALTGYMINANSIGKTTFTAYYSRAK